MIVVSRLETCDSRRPLGSELNARKSHCERASELHDQTAPEIMMIADRLVAIGERRDFIAAAQARILLALRTARKKFASALADHRANERMNI